MAVLRIDYIKSEAYNSAQAKLQAAQNVQKALQADLDKIDAEIALIEADILAMSTGFKASIDAVTAAKLEAPKEV